MINGSVITVCGNLTFDPATKTLRDGTSLTEIKVASTTRRRGSSGEWEDGGTTFYRVTCWRKLGERVVRSLRRGDAVVVVGRFQVSEWDDKEGVRRQSFDIDADVVGPDLNKVDATVNRPGRAPQPVGEPTATTTQDADPWISDLAPASEPAA